MKRILILLAAAAICLLPVLCFGQTVGQIGVPKWTASGTRTTWLTPVNGRAIGIDGSGNPSLISVGGGAGLDNISSSITGDTLNFTGALTAGRNITWRDLAGTVALTSDLSGYQPLDSDLTNIAALTTTTFGRSLLTQADAAATRSTLGLGTLATQSGTITDYLTTANAATSYQPLESDLTSIAALTTTTFGRSLLTQADAAATRSTLGLGTLATQSGTLPIANGGTGSTTAANARIALLPSMTGNAGKFLRVNAGSTDYELATVSGGGDALTSGTLGQFATTTSAQLREVLSDESGTGEFLTTTGSAAGLSSFPTFNQDTTGNAATATALQTGRHINGVIFDGTGDINITVDATTGITGATLNSSITNSSLTNLGVVTGGAWHATPVADAYISSAATWNAKESALTFSTGLTRSTNTITVNTSQNIATLSNLTSNGFVKTSGGNGTLSVDTATYLTTTGNGSSLTGLTQSQITGLTTTDRPQLANVRVTHSTLTYGATTNLDLDAEGFQTVSLTGNITFTSSNRAAGRSKTVRIIADASSRTLAFPAGWTFLGAAAPTSIAASKTAVLTVTYFGTADSDAVAAYAVQP